MKLLIIFFMLFLSTPAFSGLRMEKTGHSKYMIIGDLYSAPYRTAAYSQLSLPYTTLMAWPATNGVMLFVTYRPLTFLNNPIMLSKNLNTNLDPSRLLLEAGQNSGLFKQGIILQDLNPDYADSVGVFICDFKFTASAWPCIAFTTAEGSIEPPPPPPQPELTCNLSNAIDLRHGNLSINAVQSNRAVATAYVSCNRSATVQISIAPDTQGQVKLSGVTGLRSNLYVEGVGGGKAVNVSTGPGQKAVKFESVLTSDDSLTAGTFQGSSYAILSFP